MFANDDGEVVGVLVYCTMGGGENVVLWDDGTSAEDKETTPVGQTDGERELVDSSFLSTDDPRGNLRN